MVVWLRSDACTRLTGDDISVIRKGRFRILAQSDRNANIPLLTIPAELYANIEIVINLTWGIHYWPSEVHPY